MSKRYWLICGLLVVFFVSLNLFTSQQAKISRVQVTRLSFSPLIKTICLTGTVEYQNTTSLTAPVPSRVLTQLVKVNDTVSFNQPLLTLTSETLEQEIKDGKQQLQIAEATYKQAYDRLRLDHSKKLILYEKLKTSLQDSQELRKSGALSQKDLNQIQIEFKQIELDYDFTRTQLSTFKTQSSEAMQVLGLQRLIARKLDLRKQLSVLAPINGKIIEIASEGTPLAKDQLILRIIDPAKMVIKANANEYEVPHLSVNQEVLLKFPSLPDISTQSHIQELSHIPTAAGASTAYPVTVSLPPGLINGDIFSGMLSELWISCKSTSKTWSLPVSAVVKNLKNQYVVYAIDKHKQLHAISIIPGFRSLDRVQIQNTASLSGYTHFVNDANPLLKDRQKVRF